MFKIKDDVDLKELEKFGFNKYDDGTDNMPCIIYTRYFEPYCCIKVYEHDREIIESHDEWSRPINLALIDDLIQAGLVEKVGDNQ